MANSDIPFTKQKASLSKATVTPTRKKFVAKNLEFKPKDAKAIESLERDLRNIAADLWWSWNEIARRPFAAIDPFTWEASGHNPLTVLARMDHATFATRCQ